MAVHLLDEKPAPIPPEPELLDEGCVRLIEESERTRNGTVSGLMLILAANRPAVPLQQPVNSEL